jgi:citrate synthase
VSPTAGIADIRTEIAASDLHHIWIRGHDLTADIMGERSFAEVVFLLMAGRFPAANELRLVDTILVSLMEHGLTPSALVARITYSVSPESLQGAVAAGLIGAGSTVLGSMEECGRLLTRINDEVALGSTTEESAARIAEEYREQRLKIPGVGHVIHTEGDPRAARLLDVAAECDLSGAHVAALRTLVASVEELAGRQLPLNVTGAVAAVLLELGVPWHLHRGFALISRAAGLVAHIGEERETPITPALRKLARGQ